MREGQWLKFQLQKKFVRVAVVGLGPAGVTALKTLREEGFDAIAFERRDQIGGLWAYSQDSNTTSVIDETQANSSKFISGFSDFPVPQDYPTYFPGSYVAKYFDAYAQHFDLKPHCRFNTTVTKILRDGSDKGWDVHMVGPDGPTVMNFSKVVFGTGSNTAPKYPPMPGKKNFTGTIIHGQSFRRPEDFEGKRVMVVGIGNTACDVSLSLTKHCSKVYQAYRSGRIMLSRYLDNGIPMDATITWPIMRLKYLLDHKIPWLVSPLADKLLIKKMISDAARHEPDEPGITAKQKLARAEQKVTGAWHLTPCPSMSRKNPAVQETVMPAFNSGAITPTRGFKDFTGPSEVLLTDGTKVHVDAVIFCTGYTHDFSVMPALELDGACGLPLKNPSPSPPASSPSSEPSKETAEIDPPSRSKKEPTLPRLYQMIFPPRYASSVAFLSWMQPQESIMCVCELAAMAVAQLWAAQTSREIEAEIAAREPGVETAEEKKSGAAAEQPPQPPQPPPPSSGKYRRRYAALPSVEAMERDIDSYHAWWRQCWRKEPSTAEGFVRGYTFFRFLHGLAGTGMYENLDHVFTASGWRMKRRDRELYTWLSKGPLNSYCWRLFDTNPDGIPGCGRQVWPEARKAIKDAYDEFEAYKKSMEDEELRKKTIFPQPEFKDRV